MPKKTVKILMVEDPAPNLRSRFIKGFVLVARVRLRLTLLHINMINKFRAGRVAVELLLSQ